MSLPRPPGRATLVIAAATALALSAGCSSGGSGSGDDASKSPAPGVGLSAINAQPLDRLKDGGVFNLPLQQWITQWNPRQVDGTYGDAVEIMGMLEPKLFRADAHGVQHPVADYLESAEVTSASPMVVTYRLNPKAVWSDGKPLGYQDFKAVWQESNGSDPAYQISDPTGYNQISSVTQGADAHEVKVAFAKPYADWKVLFSPLLPAAGLGSPDAFNKGWVEKVPITAGAWRIGTANKTAQTLTLVHDPHWWGRAPKLDRITYRVLDSSAITQAYLNKEVDYAGAGNAEAYGQLKDAPDTDIRSSAPWDEVHISIGSGGPLQDVRVRQAVEKAVDRKALIKVVTKGVPVTFPLLGNHIFMPNQAGYRDNSGEYGTYDPAGAGRLLDQAGWASAGEGKPRTKDGKPLELHFILNDSSPQATFDLATVVQSLLGQAGIKVDLDKVPGNDFFEKYVDRGKFDLTTFRNTSAIFPSQIAPVFYQPQGSNVFQNYQRISSPEIDSLLHQAAQTPDTAAAAELYNRADTLIWQIGHSIELYQRPAIEAVRKGLANFGSPGLADIDYTAVGWEK
ncbi:ABC transporter family substrate-binding protein [Peterkaempfera sp. SMS 1(5)a]|uniref:ABC transporter family substrate-binding protein n=1 Tax=Peterkaempfera podocarpi TaxID=3232308 RepID=UPI00366F3C25